MRKGRDKEAHNMVAFLSKPTESDGFEQIVDFLNAHSIRYALTVNPTICIEQFWSTVKAKTINGEVQLHTLVDGKKIVVTEASVRRDLQLADKEGVDCLPNSCLSPKTTAWNEFSSTMASAIICEGSTIPSDPHHTPIIIQSSIQPQKTQKPRKPKRKDTQVPQPSDPIENVTDEAIYKELGDSLEQAVVLIGDNDVMLLISIAGVATTVSAATTTIDDDGDITLAQALIEMKSS
ncbi:hypothetical protein Tco_0815491 [Tanacetum coccineum]